MKGHNNLKRKLKKKWDMPVKVIPVVVDALRTTPKKLRQQLSDTGIETRIVELQKTMILYSARILQNTEHRASEHRTSRNLTTDLRPIQWAAPT